MPKRKTVKEELSPSHPNAQKQLPRKQKMSLHSSAPAQTSAGNSCPSSNSPKQLHFLGSKSSEAPFMDL